MALPCRASPCAGGSCAPAVPADVATAIAAIESPACTADPRARPAIPVSPPDKKTAPNLTDWPGQMPHNPRAMIALIQRVSEAQVRVSGEVVGALGLGVLAPIGVARADTLPVAGVPLVLGLVFRMFPGPAGRSV